MNAKNGMAFVTKFAPRRACIASPRVRSRGRREVTRNAGGEVESSFIWRIKDDHQTGWAPSRVAKSRFVLKYFRTSAAFKRARRGLRRRGRRVEPAAASRWTPSSRYAARVRDLPRRDTVRVPADHRARGEESIFSVPPRVPTKASLDGANRSVHPPPILHERPNASRAKPVQHASSDPPRVSPPHTITPQDASERPSVLEHILAWLQAGEFFEFFEERRTRTTRTSRRSKEERRADFGAALGGDRRRLRHARRVRRGGASHGARGVRGRAPRLVRESSGDKWTNARERKRALGRRRRGFLRARTLGPYATRRFFATIGFKPRWWHRRGYRGRVAVPEPGRRSAPADARGGARRVRRRRLVRTRFFAARRRMRFPRFPRVRPPVRLGRRPRNASSRRPRVPLAPGARRPWKRTHGGGLGARVEVTKRRGCRNVDDVHRLREDWHARISRRRRRCGEPPG